MTMMFLVDPPSLGTQKISYNDIDMIFSLYNDCWREIRKIFVVHFFSSKKFYSFSHMRTFEVKRMIENISRHVSNSKVSNFSEIIMSVSSSIVCKIAFGKRYENEGGEKSRFHDLLNETQAIFLSFFVSDFIPFLGWIDRLKGLIGRVDKTFKALDLFFEEVVKEHLDPNNRKIDEEEKHMVDILLELKKHGHLSLDLTNMITSKLFLWNLSAGTSIWVMTRLMKNPKAMKKAQEEVRSLCDKKEFIDEDDIQRLVYIKAVIYALASLVQRETNKSSH